MKSTAAEIKSLAEIEAQIGSSGFSDIEILKVLRIESKTKDYLNAIKTISDANDKTISTWLDINEKTLRHYKQSDAQINDNTKEHILYLLRLMTMGNRIFGSGEEFGRWLDTSNFIFNDEKPTGFLNTITGLRIVIDRLTAMEYGDNV